MRLLRWPDGLGAVCSCALPAVGCCGLLGRLLLRGFLGAEPSLAGDSVAARAGRWRGRGCAAAPFRELGELGGGCAGRLPLGLEFGALGGLALLSGGVSLPSSFESLRVTDLRVGMILVDLGDDGHEKGAPVFERAPFKAIQFYDRAHSFLPVYHWRPMLSKQTALSLGLFGVRRDGGGGIRWDIRTRAAAAGGSHARSPRRPTPRRTPWSGTGTAPDGRGRCARPG